MAHAQRRIAVRRWLDKEKKWANALLPSPTKERVTHDPLLAALAAKQRRDSEQRRCAAPGDKTIVRCRLALATA